MNEEIMVLIPIAFVVGIVAIVRAVVENSTRRKAIEKGIPEDVARTLFQTAPVVGDQSLKHGAVLGSLGLALMFISAIDLDFRDDRPLAFGIPLFFVGIALVLYHQFMVHKKKQD